jgi:hypothetical protein
MTTLQSITSPSLTQLSLMIVDITSRLMDLAIVSKFSITLTHSSCKNMGLATPTAWLGSLLLPKEGKMSKEVIFVGVVSVDSNGFGEVDCDRAKTFDESSDAQSYFDELLQDMASNYDEYTADDIEIAYEDGFERSSRISIQTVPC